MKDLIFRNQYGELFKLLEWLQAPPWYLKPFMPSWRAQIALHLQVALERLRVLETHMEEYEQAWERAIEDLKTNPNPDKELQRQAWQEKARVARAEKDKLFQAAIEKAYEATDDDRDKAMRYLYGANQGACEEVIAVLKQRPGAIREVTAPPDALPAATAAESQ